MSSFDKSTQPQLSGPLIGCIGSVLAAIIGGSCLILNTILPTILATPTPPRPAVVAVASSTSPPPPATRVSQTLPTSTPNLPSGPLAPDFTLLDSRGTAVKLSEELKSTNVVLVFYIGYW